MPLPIEFIALFFVLPSVVALAGRRVPPLPVLWVVGACALYFLVRDPGFDRRELWDVAALPARLPAILALFGAAAVLLILAVRYWAPKLFLGLPRQHPAQWALIMCLYPVFSVYPQSVVYRAFLIERYGSLFQSSTLLVIAGAVAFGYMHIVFRNFWSIALSMLGGVIFMARFLETRSLFVSSFEHTLYGWLIFTVGLGDFFYHGALPEQAPGKLPSGVQ